MLANVHIWRTLFELDGTHELSINPKIGSENSTRTHPHTYTNATGRKRGAETQGNACLDQLKRQLGLPRHLVKKGEVSPENFG